MRRRLSNGAKEGQIQVADKFNQFAQTLAQSKKY
jgi:hypothetical protein